MAPPQCSSAKSIAAGDHDHRILVERDDLGGSESEAGIAAGNDDRIMGNI
jgi:hypothetical protein